MGQYDGTDGRGGLALRLHLPDQGLRRRRRLTLRRGATDISLSKTYGAVQAHPVVLTRLAEADVFATLRISRRDALWQAKAIVANKPMPLFACDMDGEGSNEPTAQLPAMSLGEELVEDYVALRLSLRAHPIALLRSFYRLTRPKQIKKEF